MKLGVLSDTHDNVPLVHQAAAFLRREAPARILHLGDVTTPATVAAFAGLPVTFVRGNNDLAPELDDALAQHGFPRFVDA